MKKRKEKHNTLSSHITDIEPIDNGDNLKEAQTEAISMLQKTMDSLMMLSRIRCANKLSNSRVAGVAKEVNELIKVMSVYA